jgi:hypothetical protein
MAATNSGIEFPIENYYLDIFLTQTSKNLGQYDIITNNEIIGDFVEFNFAIQNEVPRIAVNQSFDITVTGLTSSRLEEARSYSGDFKIGVNGVIAVNDNYVMYAIDGVNYITYLDTNLTIYTVTKPSNEFERQNILRDDNSVSIDIKKTLNAFIIERSNISVYDYFNKLNNCDNLDDILDIF